MTKLKMSRPLAGTIALAVAAAIAGPAAANTIWALPYKAPPYSVPHDHAKPTPAQVGRNGGEKRAAADAGASMIIAHHKPPYHDGLPRPPRSEERDVGPRATA